MDRVAGIFGAFLLVASVAAGTSGPVSAQVSPVGDDSGPARIDSDQRVILVTGSTSGLGRELALRLGAAGEHVIVHGRDEERGREVMEEIDAGPGSARFYRADLGSFEEVRDLARAILRDYDRLDVLINNAGIGSTSPEGRHVSQDGHELRFQVNYLSGFLLTRMLLPLLRESAPARIVNVSSLAQTPIDFDDVMLEEDYSGSRAYAQSKLAQVLFTFELDERLGDDSGIAVNALHPATYMDTKMVRAAGVEPRSTVDEGARAVLNLVNSPDIGSGRFFDQQEPVRADAQAYDAEARDRLWELSEDWTGVEGPGDR
ncbi:MAG: SDR family NAD(P)-dependent oxidoreductase [Longimicrobiales bacterium]|nr:SDR family NAD(P)-dependent oxidoreductase [Longimicrobiales bacterium]